MLLTWPTFSFNTIIILYDYDSIQHIYNIYTYPYTLTLIYLLPYIGRCRLLFYISVSAYPFSCCLLSFPSHVLYHFLFSHFHFFIYFIHHTFSWTSFFYLLSRCAPSSLVALLFIPRFPLSPAFPLYLFYWVVYYFILDLLGSFRGSVGRAIGC